MIQRKFLLGDEWLYYKIYCGISSADDALLEVIKPLINELTAKSYIDNWFFIRYHDQEPHIRLRLRIVNIKNIGAIICLVNEKIKPKLREGVIWNLQTDTYVREIERYGERTMKHSEAIFYHDSELVLFALSRIQDEDLYFIFILRCVHSFLEKFKFSIDEQLKFYQKNRDAYKTEFNIGKKSKHSLDKKYRNIRPQLERFLKGDTTEFAHYTGAIIDRNNRVHKELKEILKQKNEHTLYVLFEELISSYIHMFVNKAFKSKQRFYELLVYDFLERYTTSFIKRKRA